MRTRKSSVRITLVLIGAAGLGACDPSPRGDLRRDMYASLADCQADWDRAERCEPVEERTSSGMGGTRYYGPRYSSSSSRPSSTRSIGTQSISRGGFGSSSGFHSSGG